MIYLVSIIYIAIMSIQIPVLIKKKLYNELIVYFAVMTLTFLYSYSALEGWNFPTPSSIIEAIFEPVSRMVFPRYYK